MDRLHRPELSFELGEGLEMRFQSFQYDGPSPQLIEVVRTEAGFIEIWLETTGFRIQLQPLDNPTWSNYNKDND